MCPKGRSTSDASSRGKLQAAHKLMLASTTNTDGSTPTPIRSRPRHRPRVTDQDYPPSSQLVQRWMDAQLLLFQALGSLQILNKCFLSLPLACNMFPQLFPLPRDSPWARKPLFIAQEPPTSRCQKAVCETSHRSIHRTIQSPEHRTIR